MRGKEELGRMFMSSNLDMDRKLFFLFQFLNFFVTKRVYLGLSMQINEYSYPNNVDLTV